jgi:putative hydrolases of HD superfamily
VERIGPPIKAGCPAMWDYLEGRLKQEQEKGWFGASGNSVGES